MEDVVRVPMTPQPSAGEDHQQVSRAPCSNFSVVGEFPLRTSLTVQIFSESYKVLPHCRVLSESHTNYSHTLTSVTLQFLRPIYTNFCQPFFNRISDACFYFLTVSCSNLSVLRECTLRISLTAQAFTWIQTNFSYTADLRSVHTNFIHTADIKVNLHYFFQSIFNRMSDVCLCLCKCR